MADSKIDKSIQQLIKMFGDSTKIKKLWANASPTSAFKEQTLTINNLSNYPIIIVFTINAADIGYQSLSADVVLNTSAYNQVLTYGGFANSTSDANRAASAKRVMAISGNKITFEVANRTVIVTERFSLFTDNQVCKPYQIYGFNLPGGAVS